MVNNYILIVLLWTLLSLVARQSLASPSECFSPGPLGMEDGKIRDRQINASGYYVYEHSNDNRDYYAPHQGRLNRNHRYWAADCDFEECDFSYDHDNYDSDSDSDDNHYDFEPWIQVDFGNTSFVVTGLRTQGSGNSNYAVWVSKLLVMIGDAIPLTFVEDDNNQVANFTANFDLSSTVNITFPRPIRTRYLRIIPIEWDKWIALRFEVIGCKDDNLDSELTPATTSEDTTVSVTTQIMSTTTICPRECQWTACDQNERNDCYNGGTCLGQKCSCPYGYGGEYCKRASCPAEKYGSAQGRPLSWPETPITGEEETYAHSNERCRFNTVNRNSSLAKRICYYNSSSGGQWKSNYTEEECGNETKNPGIKHLSETTVTNDNVQDVADEIGRIVEDTAMDVDIRDVQRVLRNIVNVQSPSPNVTRSLINAVSSILSKRMPADARQFANASSDIVKAFERQISYTIEKHKKFSSVKPKIAVEGVSINETEITGGIGFAVSQTDKGFGAGGSYDPDEMQTEGQGDGSSIQLPQDALFESGDTDSPKAAKVSFIGYDDTRLFQSEQFNQDVDGFELVGPILSATVLGKKVVNLNAPVVVQISPKKANVDAMINKTKCVYWDFSKRDGIGDWAEDGCELISAESGMVTCQCNHLTNFAVLVDFSGEPLSFTLDVISKVGCAVSILGLSLTLMIFLCCKGLRLSLQRKILIQLCISLLGLYFAFMLGIDGTTSEIGCIIVAAFLHYFVISTMLWMGVEARHMYITLVSESARVSRKFLIKASCFAWGVGLIPVVVVLAVKLIQRFDYLASSYCFILPDEGLIYGLLLPIGLVILHNLITFFLVARTLLGSRSYVEKADLQNKESDTGDGEVFQKKRGVKDVSQRLLNAFSVSVLLGVTWVFGFLAIEEARFAFQLLFCICNSFQGFFIFILFCFAQKDVRRLVCAKCFNVAPSQTPRTPRTPKTPNASDQKKAAAAGVNDTYISDDTVVTGESYTQDNDTIATTLDGMTMTELK